MKIFIVTLIRVIFSKRPLIKAIKLYQYFQNIKLILFIAFSNYMWFTEFSLNCVMNINALYLGLEVLDYPC